MDQSTAGNIGQGIQITSRASGGLLALALRQLARFCQIEPLGQPVQLRVVPTGSRIGSAQYVVIAQYPIEEEKGSVGSASLHVKHYRIS